MESIISFVTWILGNYTVLFAAIGAVIAALVVLFGALAALFVLIPGEWPENWFYSGESFFKKVGDFVAKFSKK